MRTKTVVAALGFVAVVAALSAVPAAALPQYCSFECSCQSNCSTSCTLDGPEPRAGEPKEEVGSYTITNCGNYGLCITSPSCSTPTCSNLSCTNFWYGTSGGDTIDGGSTRDCIYGYGGSDTIDGKAGDDRIYAGDGTDTVEGDSGDDCLWGDAGGDYLDGGTGYDYGNGGSGSDTCVSIEAKVSCP